jgi:hypothetical protein
MIGARKARAALIGFALWFAALAVGVGAVPPTATAAEPNRAAVIVDTGAEVHEVVITFTEDSITGVEALQLAGADPETNTTDSGTAVCALYGVGRPAAPDCVDGQGDNDDSWAYFRAPSGESTFDDSADDPGSSQVHDGDVEGWKWGDGTTAPAYVSVADLMAPPAAGEPPTTDPPTTVPPPTTRPPTTRPPTTRPPVTRPVTNPPPATAPVAARPTVGATVRRPKPVVDRVVVKRPATLPLTGGVKKSTPRTTVTARSAGTFTGSAMGNDDSNEPVVADPHASDRIAGAALASASRDSSTTWSYVGLGMVVGSIIGSSILFQTRRRAAWADRSE